MSYVSPPESRSRVENIKKKFEISNNDLSTSLTDNTNFTKTPLNKSSLATKPQSSNGVKGNISPRKKVQCTSSSPIEIPKKSPNSVSSVKAPVTATAKAERQYSNPYGKSHIRRSPAFRCDKIVKGRNVTGQTGGIRERTRSVVDNRVKLFEDGESVKSVVKKLTSTPLVFADTAESVTKLSRPPLQKQLAVEDDGIQPVTLVNSGKISSASVVSDISSVNNQSASNLLSNKVVASSETRLKKSETVPPYTGTGSVEFNKLGTEYASVSKVSNQVAAKSFLHKYEQNKLKLSAETQSINSNSSVGSPTNSKRIPEQREARFHPTATSIVDGSKANNWKDTNDVKHEKLLPDTLPEETSCKRDVTLTDTLKAALKAPLPSGPPPKKPPRTFAHNSPSQNIGHHNVSPPNITASAIDTESGKQLKYVKSALEKVNVEKTGKPVRSKTESQIMLKKLENVLLNHQQGVGGVVLRPRSPLVKRLDKATVTYNDPDLSDGKSVGRIGPLPNIPPESEHKATNIENNSNKFGGCLNFNCVSADSSNPMYSQIHFYEKVPEKQSEFFVDVPKNQLSKKVISKPYGTLLHCRSRSEEHIYAEPFDYLNKTQNHRPSAHKRSPNTAMKSGESVGDLSKIGTLLEDLQKQTSPLLSAKNPTSKTTVLHYLCTPLHPDGTAGVAENGLMVRSNESKKIEAILQKKIAEKQVSNETQSVSVDSGSDERKKPPLLRLAALVRGGQSGTAVDIPSKVDRTKIQLLMNQAFGSPLQGLPTNPLELAGSDSDSMASTPDDGGFTVIFPSKETEPAGIHSSPDSVKAGLTAARCVDPPVDGEDSSSTNSADQQEQLTRLSEERKVYVRRVSSRVYHRVRSTSSTPSTFPHLFQCILLVGLNLDSSDKKTKVPYIKTKYPLDADVPPHIEHLCFPDAKDWPPPVPTSPTQPGSGGNDDQSYSLVITSETGVRRFGYCRRVQPEGSNLCLPLAYCIISPFRASGFYYKILAELESRHGQPEWLQTAFIKELYSCQFPAPGQGLRLSTANTNYNVAGPICNMVTTVVRRPLDSRLEERDLTQLFSALPVPALLQLFGSLLLERKVILISNSLSRLSSCVEALQSILYPFSWQHTLIPVLPTSLLDICLSPTPYIVGILRGRDANTVPGSIDESMMVDLDESRIVQGVGDEASILPSRLRRCLKVALQLVTNTTQPWDASRNVLVSEAFVRMFVEVCGHYRNHIVTQQDGLKVFERESFIKAVSSQSTRLFLEWFTETAMFSAFIESRLESESDIRGMFDQRCMEHSEEMENNTKLFLRNYKVLNKKVKTFGDRLKDWTPFS